jgi:hypothetical protein
LNIREKFKILNVTCKIKKEAKELATALRENEGNTLSKRRLELYNWAEEILNAQRK